MSYTPISTATAKQKAYYNLPSTTQPLNKFDRSHRIQTNYDTDYLYPVEVFHVYPGEIMEMHLSTVMQVLNLKVPLLDLLNTKFYFFYVRTQTVWNNWKLFIGEPGETDEAGEEVTVPLQIPTITVLPTLGSLYDYLNKPISAAQGGTVNTQKGIQVNALVLRGLNKIYNENFMKQRINAKRHYSKGDNGTDIPSDYGLFKVNKDLDYFTSMLPSPQYGEDATIPVQGIGQMEIDNDIYLSNQNPNSETLGETLTLQANSAITEGAQADIELSTYIRTDQYNFANNNIYSSIAKREIAPIVKSAVNPNRIAAKVRASAPNAYNDFTKILENDDIAYGLNHNFEQMGGGFSGDNSIYKNKTDTILQFTPNIRKQPTDLANDYVNAGDSLKIKNNSIHTKISNNDLSNIKINLQGGSISVREMRDNIVEQHYRELINRSGAELYRDFVYAVWGVDIGDSTLQRAEYLGGFKLHWNVQTIAQTGAGTAESPQGNLTSIINAGCNNKFCFRKGFPDYGYVYVLVRTKGDVSYCQGQDDNDRLLTKGDYYLNQFEGISEQPVYQKEIYQTGLNEIDEETGESIGDNAIRGYQPYGANEIKCLSKAQNAFRALNVNGQRVLNLSQRTFVQNYLDAPQLSPEFIESNTPLKNMITLQEGIPSEAPIQAITYLHIKHYRVMQPYGTPGVEEI